MSFQSPLPPACSEPRQRLHPAVLPRQRPPAAPARAQERAIPLSHPPRTVVVKALKTELCQKKKLFFRILP